MLIQKERDRLNAIIRSVSDKAQRIEYLNKMAQERPIVNDAGLQKETVGEALRLAMELRRSLDETIALLEKDYSEKLEVL